MWGGGKVWKATKTLVMLESYFVFFLLNFMCVLFFFFNVFFVYGDFSESPNSGQHGAISAMAWNPPNHAEMQKAGNWQEKSLHQWQCLSCLLYPGISSCVSL